MQHVQTDSSSQVYEEMGGSKRTVGGDLKPQCPLCRSVQGKSLKAFIKKIEEKEFRERNKDYIHVGTTCKGCGKKDIAFGIYKCLWCKDFYLCEKCFDMNIFHSEHFYFFTKCRVKCKWGTCTSRRIPKTLRTKKLSLANFLVKALPYYLNKRDVAARDNFNGISIAGCGIGT